MRLEIYNQDTGKLEELWNIFITKTATERKKTESK